MRGGEGVSLRSFDDSSLSVHLSEEVADGFGSHAASLTKLRESERGVRAGEKLEDEFVGWRAEGFRGGGQLEQAECELILGSLKNQRQVGASGGGAMLDGERKLVGFALEVEIGVAPGVKLGASTQGLSCAEMLCSLSGVMNDDHSEAEEALKFAKVGEDGGDIGRSIFVDAVQPNEGVEEEELRLKKLHGLSQSVLVLKSIESE